MGRRRDTPEDIIAKPGQVDVLVSQGQTVDAAAHSIGVTQTTYHCRREPSSASSSSITLSASKSSGLRMPGSGRRSRDSRSTESS